MRTIKWMLPLLVLAVMLGGCPYKSAVPIDQPTVKIDEKLLGRWESKSSSDTKYTISKIDAFTYKIEKKTKDSKEPTIYNAYASDVAGEKFLNITEVDGMEKAYYLYKMTVSPSGAKITLAGITENVDETFESSADLKAFIAKHKGLSFFYDKEEDVYIREE